MTIRCYFLASLFFATHAASTLFTWDIPTNEKPVLVRVSRGGFVPPQRSGWAEIKAILPSGKIMEYTKDHANAPWQSKHAGLKTRNELEAILNSSKGFSNVDLRNEPYDGPTDYPAVSFFAKNSRGELVEFYSIAGQSKGYLPDTRKEIILSLVKNF